MTQVILLSFLCMGVLPLNNQKSSVNKQIKPAAVSAIDDNKGLSITQQADNENEKMLVVIFRNQNFCRIELKDFEFEVKFNLVSATVYFSGAGFKDVATGYLTSTDLKPIRKFMDQCVPGTMVVFDNVKVKGPDDIVRTIRGTSYLLK